jgi:hypothetical protein
MAGHCFGKLGVSGGMLSRCPAERVEDARAFQDGAVGGARTIFDRRRRPRAIGAIDLDC